MQHYHPLQLNPDTGEPFLRLPSPRENIIITPPRMSDALSIVSILNDPPVCRWLDSPPYPYFRSHAEEWLTRIKRDTDAILQELELASKEDPEGPPRLMNACPVRMIREVKDDGSEVYLGELTLDRCGYPDVRDWQERERLCRENAERETGDPGIVWCWGDYLAASHHGQGIMSLAVGTIMQEWAIPRMGVRRIRVETFKGNIGSVRVFEKNGFAMEKTVEFVKVTNFGVTIEGMNVLQWERK